MTNLDALHTVYRVNQVMLNIAREEKPSGSWPAWAIEADMELTAIERELRLAAKAVR
jgi:hypothetical protein